MPTEQGREGMKKCKVVVIGDASVGKTCLLYAYANPGEFLSEHVPTVFNNFEADITATNGDDSEAIRLTLWDTAGQEEYQQLRQMCYGGATPSSSSPTSATRDKKKDAPASKEEAAKSSASDDVSVFIVCFAWNNPQSFTNVEMKWYKEIRQVAAEIQKRNNGGTPPPPGVPQPRPFSVILVATKADLKNTDFGSRNALKPSDCELLRRKIGADAFVDCSARTGDGVKEVFEAALTSWYERHLTEEEKVALGKKRCTLL